MARVIPGRFTAQIDEPFVVFLIGIRVNRPLAFSTVRLQPSTLSLTSVCVTAHWAFTV
jgi:hypothetical protein